MAGRLTTIMLLSALGGNEDGSVSAHNVRLPVGKEVEVRDDVAGYFVGKYGDVIRLVKGATRPWRPPLRPNANWNEATRLATTDPNRGLPREIPADLRKLLGEKDAVEQVLAGKVDSYATECLFYGCSIGGSVELLAALQARAMATAKG